MAMGTNDTSRLDGIFKKANRKHNGGYQPRDGGTRRPNNALGEAILNVKPPSTGSGIGTKYPEYERPQIKETDESDYSEIILSNPKAFVDSLSLEAAQQLQLELIEFYRIMNTLVCKLDDKTKS